MVGNSPAMQRVYDQIRKFSTANAPVLITGESGTGKELVARALHERSAYGSGPFVAINCAALPPTLIAAELFGHEKGAFTGANQRRIGRLESAHGGTIFLDEIGDLPLEQQAHLLRFLQEGTIDRVGGRHPVDVNARVICATNVDLGRAISEGRFREDLYYRLHVLSLHLPSLRARGDDVELLATFFLRKFADDHGRAVAGFSDEAWRCIREHGWPGNVRELISSVRRAIVMADTPWISARDLGLDEPRLRQRQTVAAPPAAARPAIDEHCLRRVLAQNGGNVTAAARELSLSRMTIYRLMRRYGQG
jgi:DNA-binding NtrC family response regulator